MSQQQTRVKEKYYRIILSLIGLGIISQAAWQVATQPFKIESITLALLALVFSKVTSIRVKGDITIVTISEAFIYLAFLLCGAAEAVLVAGVLTLAESLYYAKGRLLVIAFNVSANCFSVFCAVLAVRGVFGDIKLLQYNRNTFVLYLLALTGFSIIQGMTNILMLIISLALRPGKSLWLNWIKGYSWGLVTSLSGMLIAGVMHACVYYYGYWAIFLIIPLLIAAHAIAYPYIKNIHDARKHNEEINAVHERTLEAFATAIDAKTQSNSFHVERVQIYVEGLAELLNLSEQDRKALQAGALLQDIGNIAVPDYILNKPGKLSAAEFEKMKLHTVAGAEIVEQIHFPYALTPIVRHHHERWDGKGYPDGLKGEDIPLTARILTIADGFVAMCEERQYRQAKTLDEAVDYLRKERGKIYDPYITDLFLNNLSVFEERIAELKNERQHSASENNLAAESLVNQTKSETDDKVALPAFLQTIQQSHELNQSQYALFQIAEKLAGVIDKRQAMNIFTDLLDNVVPFNPENDTCVLFWLDEAQQLPTVIFSAGFQSAKFTGLHLKSGEGVTGWALSNAEVFANGNPALDIYPLEVSKKGGVGFAQYLTVVVLPVVSNSELLGAISIYSRSLSSFSNDHIERLKRATLLLSNVLSSAHKHDEAQKLIYKDALTELPNARYLQTHFQREQKLSVKYPLTILLMDLSGYRLVMEKADNKPTGQVIREMAKQVKSQLRRTDTLVHYMGDQFIVILREVSSEIAEEISSRIQTALIESRSFLLSVDDAVSGIGLGLARYRDDGEQLEELLDAAQIRMIADKAARTSYTKSLIA